jgi:hypothetical protein
MEQISTDEWLCVDQFDLSGVSNTFGSKRMIAAEESLCYLPPEQTSGTLYPKRFNGVESMEINNAGYLDAAINLAAAKAALEAQPIVTKGDGRALGSTCYLWLGQAGSMEYGGAIGKLAAFALELKSDRIVTPAVVFEFGSKTTTQTGTSRVMPTAAAGQSLYMHVHVVAVTGTLPTMALVEESSAIGDFTDAVAHGSFATVTSTPTTWRQRVVVPGPITDTNHRFRWTVGGSGSPSFLVRLALGIR